MESLSNNEEKGKFEKIESLKTMEEIGLPVLPYLILNAENFRQQIADFVEQYHLDKIMVRTDGQGKGSPRILDAAIDDDTFGKIEDFLSQGLLVFIANQGNIYRNPHSANIEITKEGAYIEVVGPGFMASDLNRGSMTPHETIHMDAEGRIKDRQALPEEYQNARQTRLNDPKTDLAALKDNRSYLLEYEDYPPIDEIEMETLRDAAVKLNNYRRMYLKGNFIASMSFVDLGNESHPNVQPVFWDIHKDFTEPTDSPSFYKHEGD